MYDAAAAERAELDRAAVTAGPASGRGVEVVDAAPEQLPPALGGHLPGAQGRRPALTPGVRRLSRDGAVAARELLGQVAGLAGTHGTASEHDK